MCLACFMVLYPVTVAGSRPWSRASAGHAQTERLAASAGFAILLPVTQRPAWIVRPVREERLRPWIRHYLIRRGPAPAQTIAARVLPRAGASFFLGFAGDCAREKRQLGHAVNGIHQHHYTLPVAAGIEVDHLIVDFTAAGLARFTGVPSVEIREQLVDGACIFEKSRTGLGLTGMHDAMRNAQSDERISILETFLLSRLLPTTPRSRLVAHLVREMERTGKLHGADQLEGLTSLSLRQIERFFKEEVGVSRRSLLMLLRFERAKSLLDRNHASLTHIAQAAGFYDQAQFIREIKRRTGLVPGDIAGGKPICHAQTP